MSEQVPPADGAGPDESAAHEAAGAEADPSAWTPDELQDVGDLQGYYPSDPAPQVPANGGPAAAPNPTTPPVPDAPAGWGQPGAQAPLEWGTPALLPPPPTGASGVPAGWVPTPGSGQYYGAADQPGVIPLRPLRLGEVIEGTFRTFRRYPATVFTLGVSLALLQSVIYISLFWLIDRSNFISHWNKLDPADLASWPRTWSGYSDISPSWFLGWLIFAAVLMLLTYVIGSLAYSHVGGEAILGAHLSAGDAWRLTRRQLGRGIALWLLVLLIGLGVFGAGFALIVLLVSILPVIGVLIAIVVYMVMLAFLLFVGVRLYLAPVVLALEDLGPRASIVRSFTLARGSSWRILGYLLMSALIAVALSVVVSLPFNLIGSLAGTSNVSTTSGSLTLTDISTVSIFTQLLGNLVAAAVTLPFTYLFVTMLYTDIRMRKENLASVLSTTARQRGH
jgi:hypothetical protein